MRVLLDHNVPRQLRSLLTGHEVRTAREMGWDALENGDLLDAAQAGGFEIVVTGDKKLSREQELEGRTIALVVLGTTKRRLLQRDPAPVIAAVAQTAPGEVTRLPEVLARPRKPRPAPDVH